MVLSAVSEPIPLKTDADGVIRVGGTRVTLDTLVSAYQEGATPEEIVEQYPSISLADVYGSITYYLRHRDAVEDYLGRNREEAARVRAENERRFNPHGVRERLAARLGR